MGKRNNDAIGWRENPNDKSVSQTNQSQRTLRVKPRRLSKSPNDKILLRWAIRWLPKWLGIKILIIYKRTEGQDRGSKHGREHILWYQQFWFYQNQKGTLSWEAHEHTWAGVCFQQPQIFDSCSILSLSKNCELVQVTVNHQIDLWLTLKANSQQFILSRNQLRSNFLLTWLDSICEISYCS